MAQVQWTGQKVRETFLDFFEKKGHTIGTYEQLDTTPGSILALFVLEIWHP